MNKAEARRERRRYLSGAAISAVLTVAAFAAVWAKLPRTVAVGLIGALALLQIVVQLRYFLHINLRQKREDLQLILFSLLLLIIMAGGTVWILFNLEGRM